MTVYNFDEIIDRRGTGALKTDALQERYGRSDLLPMWVADMDFRCGDFITEALKTRCDEGIYGYTLPSEAYYRSVIRWLEDNHRWKIEKEWFSYIPGIVKGIALAVMHFTLPGDAIIIQPPVYHPFRLVPAMHRRRIVNNPLIEENGKYRMDLDGLRRLITPDCKLLLLANPHNPIGITWDAETLKELAAICHEKKVLVISDEIHSDMALFGRRHTPFATVSEQAAQNSITFMAPSKTFNIAGIVSSYAVVINENIRNSFYGFLHASELDEGTIFAYVAAQAAYTHGKEWMRQMLRYVEENILFADHYLKENIPAIRAIIPEASFLLWLDCRELGLNAQALNDLFIHKAGLALNDGTLFGEEGAGFMRMNVGCPRAIVKQALEQLKRAIEPANVIDRVKPL
ncbi:MAG: PatB family C-S lyase [Dysgonamonadaceae bacterium]|jgi:cystathionine beta-lyase|nr:PatB family C-S lyase [Dysgonamonadaceae bacterium]